MTDFANFTGFKNLVINFSKQIIEEKKDLYPDGVNCLDKKSFLKDNPNTDVSVFNKLDIDGDGYISDREYFMITSMDGDGDGTITQEEVDIHRQECMNEALFFARRNIDKWFSVDIDRDGYWSNVEAEMAEYRMGEDNTTLEHSKDAAMTNEELAKKYNMQEIRSGMKIEKWIDEWLEYIKTDILKNNYQIDLTPNEMSVLKAEMYKQLNTWLFKTGDNKTNNAPLYNSLNVTSYTRLMTTEATVSCCGGNITPPPMAPDKGSCAEVFRPLEFTQEEIINAEKEGIELDETKLVNNSQEIKNRLAWAAFNTPPKENLDNRPDHTVWESFTDFEYTQYHNEWNNIRNTSAQELRDMLKPENKNKKSEFEQKSIMTVNQMVQYIDIVESVTGKAWDDDDWEVNAEQFYQIGQLVNDTANDENLLDGKVRKDIPENRQKLLKFLEEKGWLNDQFNDGENVKPRQDAANVNTYFQRNEKNFLSFNKEQGEATRRVLSKIEQNKIIEAKSKELEQQYDSLKYNWIVQINEYGDLSWAVSKKPN